MLLACCERSATAGTSRVVSIKVSSSQFSFGSIKETISGPSGVDLQDLEDEGLAVRVGIQALRWVLMEHAEPWLLTVSSKHGVQPEASRAAEPRQAGSSRTKRCRRLAAHQSGEPPAKRAQRDERGGEEQRMSRETEDEKTCSAVEEDQGEAEEVPESSSALRQANGE